VLEVTEEQKMNQDDIEKLNDKVKLKSQFIHALKEEIHRNIIGQTYLIDRLLIGLLANGHVLLEGVPGLAKTLSVSTLSKAIKASFKRVQFTPDLLPADLIGTQIYNPKDGSFKVKKGPVFTNIVLADEINRAPAKVQSALLEAMQERQVTIGDETFFLEDPFLVLATQNPIDQEGTYPLPEAQLDRFMLKVKVTYPNKKEELAILQQMAKVKVSSDVKPVITPKDILDAREVVDEIYIDEKLEAYIVDLVIATREPELYNLDIKNHIEYGASPRATINLTLAAKAYAFLQGRGYVVPQDIKSIGMDVLGHRIIVTYEAEADQISSEDIVNQVFDTVLVP
jgi:MoxR-like ATPase